MLRFVKYPPYGFDYQLEDGTLLHPSEWNGEKYFADGHEYVPVYNKIGDDEYEIIGFEKW